MSVESLDDWIGGRVEKIDEGTLARLVAETLQGMTVHVATAALNLAPEVIAGMAFGQAIVPIVLSGLVSTAIFSTAFAGSNFLLEKANLPPGVRGVLSTGVAVLSTFALGVKSPAIMKALRSRKLISSGEKLREAGLKVLAEKGTDVSLVRKSIQKETAVLKQHGFDSLEDLEIRLGQIKKESKFIKSFDLIRCTPGGPLQRSLMKRAAKDLGKDEFRKIREYSRLSSLHSNSIVSKRVRELSLFAPDSQHFNWRRRVVEADAKYGHHLDEIKDPLLRKKAYSSLMRTLKKGKSNDFKFNIISPEARFHMRSLNPFLLRLDPYTKDEMFEVVLRAKSGFKEFKKLHNHTAEIYVFPVGKHRRVEKAGSSVSFMWRPPKLPWTSPSRAKTTVKKIPTERPSFLESLEALRESVGDRGYIIGFDVLGNNAKNVRMLKLLPEKDRAKAVMWHEMTHGIMALNPKLATETGLHVGTIYDELGIFGGFTDGYGTTLYPKPFSTSLYSGPLSGRYTASNNEFTSIAAEHLSHPDMASQLIKKNKEQMLALLSILDTAK
jgi:hypothetical protein